MATWQDRFVQAFGDAASRSGVLSEMAGKIFGALYLTPGPLSLDDICERLGASKGNVSVQVRDLLSLGMVRKVPGRGRRHYYEAVTDLWPIATELIGRRLEQEARTLLNTLQALDRAPKGRVDADLKSRVAALQAVLQMSVAMVEAFRRGQPLSPDMLRKAAG
ncbi:MAG: MarR family transcriptional regulator [Dehalococcoidia bacterium]|nr:MarR family transcriptional regulator [Dehalococcoidia bacterium]